MSDDFESIGKVSVVGSTDEALKIRTGGPLGATRWIPRSVVSEDGACDEGDVGEMFVKAWFRKREDL